MRPQQFAPGSYFLPGSLPVTLGEGEMVINRFLVTGSKKRMLIDAGAPAQAADTLRLIGEVMDPAELDYIFLSHLDVDHLGAVEQLLVKAPRARLVGGMGNLAKGTLFHAMPADRMAVVWPGESIDLGDRRLRAETALIEDGGTMWLYEEDTGTLFPSDGFGVMAFSNADVGALPGSEAYARGFGFWHAMFPTLPMVDRARFARAVEELQGRGLRHIAPVHGPLLSGGAAALGLKLFAKLPEAPPLEPVPLPPALRLAS
jgi:flavorubredoxin